MQTQTQYEQYPTDPFNENNGGHRNQDSYGSNNAPYSYVEPVAPVHPHQSLPSYHHSYAEPPRATPSPGPGDPFARQPHLNSGYDLDQGYASPGTYPSSGYGAPPVTTNAPSAGPPAGIYMPDARLTSPPPFIHHSSSQQSGLTVDGQAQAYYPPPRPYSPYTSNVNDGRTTPSADLADEPLLHRQHTGDGRYGTPFGGNPSMAADGSMVNPDEPITMRYGPAPERILRRLKTTKRVQSVNTSGREPRSRFPGSLTYLIWQAVSREFSFGVSRAVCSARPLPDCSS